MNVLMKQDKTRFILIVIIDMYITHSMLCRVIDSLIHFYEFATNRNPPSAKLMHSSSGVLY